MKIFLLLFTTTLSLGSIISLHLSAEAILYILLYLLGAYHLYRVNYTRAFFLTFHSKKEEKTDEQKIRLGPGEFDLKDQAEKNEDQFIEIFDWKKVLVRQILSWGLFAVAIYVFFFRLRIEISVASVMPLISFLFIMRTVSIGHLLVPIGINLVTVLLVMPELAGRETIFFGIYVILLIFTLALIYPSEERLRIKLKEWNSGRWTGLLSTIGIIFVTFMAGKYLFADIDLYKKEPKVRPVEVQRQLKKISRLDSSLKRMTEQGIFQNKALSQITSQLADKMKELSQKEKLSPDEWKEFQEESQKIESEAHQEMSGGNAPPLTDKLLEEMKADVRSRQNTGLDPFMEKQLEDFLKRAENFKGSDGNELVSQYREMKFGKGGYYQEETEFDHDPAGGSASQFLIKMRKAEEEKKKIVEKLNRNIEEIKKSPDDGSMAVNTALKEELDQADSLSAADRENIKQELARAAAIAKNIQERTQNSGVKDKLEKLEVERNHLANEVTPHMNAAAKSELAEKILNHHKKVEAAGREVKEQIGNRIKERELKEDKIPEKENASQFWKKILKFGSIALGGLLILWFLRLVNKKGIKKVEGIPEEVKEELIQELKALRKKKLSPRDEIIETYNVFHNALSALVFHTETPPSCIVYEGIKSAEPELKDPTYTVTETFARTFYGDRDVTSSDLKTFRRDMSRIFSFFGIQI